MTSYTFGLVLCAVVGTVGSLGFTIPADVPTQARHVLGVSDTTGNVRTGVSGPLKVPYTAVERYMPRHAAWTMETITVPLGVRRHGVGGGTWPSAREDRLDQFIQAMRGTA